MANKNKSYDWPTSISIVFWIACIISSFAKQAQSGTDWHLMIVLDIINSNTFSTYGAMVIVMSYQFFSTKKKKQEEKSGLSRRYIPVTIIASILYCVLFVVNICRYNLCTCVVLLVSSVVYVYLFWTKMRAKSLTGEVMI